MCMDFWTPHAASCCPQVLTVLTESGLRSQSEGSKLSRMIASMKEGPVPCKRSKDAKLTGLAGHVKPPPPHEDGPLLHAIMTI